MLLLYILSLNIIIMSINYNYLFEHKILYTIIAIFLFILFSYISAKFYPLHNLYEYDIESFGIIN
jgi:hypothetical protein